MYGFRSQKVGQRAAKAIAPENRSAGNRRYSVLHLIMLSDLQCTSHENVRHPRVAQEQKTQRELRDSDSLAGYEHNENEVPALTIFVRAPKYVGKPMSDWLAFMRSFYYVAWG
jgi:hypothetical protein